MFFFSKIEDIASNDLLKVDLRWLEVLKWIVAITPRHHFKVAPDPIPNAPFFLLAVFASISPMNASLCGLFLSNLKRATLGLSCSHS